MKPLNFKETTQMLALGKLTIAELNWMNEEDAASTIAAYRSLKARHDYEAQEPMIHRAKRLVALVGHSFDFRCSVYNCPLCLAKELGEFEGLNGESL